MKNSLHKMKRGKLESGKCHKKVTEKTGNCNRTFGSQKKVQNFLRKRVKIERSFLSELLIKLARYV